MLQWSAARYRLLQGLRAMSVRPDPSTEAIARRHLDVRGMRLFSTLSPRDQFHSARTASILREAGLTDPELLQAALLHDVGKGAQALWQRVVYVLLAATSPRLLARLARPGRGWRGALDRSRRHASVGAELARAAGCSERIVGLIANHHATAADPEQRALQSADERA